ncbi:addiction module toxin RelE [Candidatus Micrarchaeota archaeon CG10_big_fil_rev_8_21_14_0_10_45_29]|nr:MAG: addiction module toxin RelE [Candidatus Micrarchaeota archaeon CG10_big_fil_rev_8_21_14_0_10_45_29]
MFEFDLSPSLRLKMEKFAKKDRKKSLIIEKKINEIVKADKESVMRYKNLRYGLKDLKRVHIDKHFVLMFRVYLDRNLILFVDFDHHDKIY